MFGTVLFGRMHAGAGADRAMGLFINTLPIRLDLDGTGVEESLRIAHARLAELLSHEHASLALAQRCSGVAPPAPLFSALLNYRHNTPAAMSGSGPDDGLAGVEWLGAEERTNYPLSLSVEDFGEALGLTAQVAEPISADRVCGYMQRALEQLADALEYAPDRPVRELDILPADERTYLLEDLNRTAAPYPPDLCIHELFEAQVRQAPEAVAVVHDDERVSYGELNARANRLAHHLIGLGVKPGDSLATMLDRSVSLVVAQLAILKAGGVYVPIDRALPSARQEWLIADCAARLVLSGSDDGDLVEATIPVLPIEPLIAGTGSSADLGLALSAEAAAYVMYTSGSTGLPKGVVVPHRAVNRLVINNGYAQFSSSDRVAWVGNPAFDISTLEVWAPLLCGSSLIVIPYTDVLQPEVLRSLVQQHRITVLHLTAGLFSQSAYDLDPVLASLRLLLVGGDAVDVAAVARVLKQNGPQHLLHCYGPTETTTFATVCEITATNATSRRLPIGRPIANTRIYLLNGHGAPVPFGAVGELYIGGAGVARGYLNRPELTAERFMADPFSDEPGEPGARMYRTGDLARYLPDGNLEFLGRNDDQVKIRGFRIEPGEIAARLCEHAWVREAVVVAHADGAGDKRLVAYVVARTTDGSAEADGAGLAASLRAHLGGLLPDYMVPSAFVRLEALPLTPNGKLDRKALPVPDDDAYARRAYEAPQGEIETLLAGIWAELLGIERIGRHDHFFELGGHSLLAVQLLGRTLAVGLKFSAADLFEAPILKELTSKIHFQRRPSVPEVISVQATGSQPPLFFVPTGSGDCSYVLSLVEEMDVDCPIYALPWPPFKQVCPPTLEGIAAEVILAIRESQPRGPYRFAGYSSGAILAYAIAQHLLSLDEAVSFIALIDVALPANPSSISPTQKVREVLLNSFESLDDERFEILERFAGQSSIAQLLEKAQQIGAMPLDRDLHNDVLMYEKIAQFQRALDLYKVPSLPVEIHQFYANEPLLSRRARPRRNSMSPEASSPMRGWDRVLSEATIHTIPVPGDHMTMMDVPENRRALARQLSTALNRSLTTKASNRPVNAGQVQSRRIDFRSPG
uniref:non-ribosomal peptide synthetase n=1 Tax=Rhizobium sp. T1473 TaxID=555321 RepID=UPI00403F0980